MTLFSISGSLILCCEIPLCIIENMQNQINPETAFYEKVFVLSTYQRLGIKLIFALAGIIGPIILIATDFSLGLTVPGYSFLKNSISSLAWTPWGWLQTMGFMAIGLLIELFVAGLLFSIKGSRGFGFSIIVLMFFGFGLLLVGGFHTDAVEGVTTLEGAIHIWSAKCVFWLFPVAVLLMAPTLRKEPYWRPVFFYSIGAASFAIIFMISSLLIPEDFTWFGLFERILVADEIIWVLVMAVRLLRLTLLQRKMIKNSGSL
jgi:hypothetical protein